MYFRTSDKMKTSDKLAIRQKVGGGGGAPQFPPLVLQVFTKNLVAQWSTQVSRINASERSTFSTNHRCLLNQGRVIIYSFMAYGQGRETISDED